MTYKNLLFQNTSPILLEHLKISFLKYSRTLTLGFPVNSKKTQNYMCDEKFTSLCTQKVH